MNRKTLALAVGLLCVAVAVLAVVVVGGDDQSTAGSAAAASRPAAVAPIEVPLKPEHHSGVTGTALLVPDGENLNVTLKLSKPIAATLPALRSSFPAIKALVWFHMNKETDWRLDSSTPARGASVTMVNDPYFNP